MGFEIHHIEIEQFAAIEDPERGEVSFSILIKPGCNINLRAVVISIEVKFSVVEDRPFLLMKANSFFKIAEDSWQQMIDSKSGYVVIPNNLLVSFVQISISQMRGMMYVKTENTPFSKYMIPVISVDELDIKKNLVIKPDGTVQNVI